MGRALSSRSIALWKRRAWIETIIVIDECQRVYRIALWKRRAWIETGDTEPGACRVCASPSGNGGRGLKHLLLILTRMGGGHRPLETEGVD